MTLKRLLILLALVAATCTLSLIGGSSLPGPLSVAVAHADACNQGGDPQWPNCSTVCAVTGNQCDEGSDGDVDWGWVCASFGDNCPDDGGGGGDTYGCTDSVANNYNSSANVDDGSCSYYQTGSDSGIVTLPNGQVYLVYGGFISALSSLYHVAYACGIGATEASWLSGPQGAPLGCLVASSGYVLSTSSNSGLRALGVAINRIDGVNTAYEIIQDERDPSRVWRPWVNFLDGG